MGVVPMGREHLAAVARLHRESIVIGLVAAMGQKFGESLYWGIAHSPHSFVLVYEDERHATLGFICCALHTGRMYRSVLSRRFFPLAFRAATRLWRPSLLHHAWQSIRRPSTFRGENYANWNLPEAEVVSIGVSPEAQGRQVGTHLMNAAFERFRAARIDRIRVWTTEDNEQATVFYQRRGFTLLGTRRHHEGNIRVFVTDLSRSSDAAPTSR